LTPSAAGPEEVSVSSRTADTSRETAAETAEGDDFWNTLLSRVEGQLSLLARATLNKAEHRLTGRRLTISVEPFQCKQAQNKEVVALLETQAEQLLGYAVQVSVTAGALAGPQGPDRLEGLIRRGGDVITLEN
jgi:anti-sigma factor ChrR (cupin superfamily)